MNDIDQYIQNLLKKAGFWDEDNLDLLTEEIKPVLIDTILTNAVNEMSPEDQQFSQHLFDSEASADEIFQYIQDTVENFDEILFETLDEFEKNYLKAISED
mgnify:CR=1 FL=1